MRSDGHVSVSTFFHHSIWWPVKVSPPYIWAGILVNVVLNLVKGDQAIAGATDVEKTRAYQERREGKEQQRKTHFVQLAERTSLSTAKVAQKVQLTTEICLNQYLREVSLETKRNLTETLKSRTSKKK